MPSSGPVPRATRRISRSWESGRAVPVGLFGEASRRTAGRSRRMTSSTPDASRAKSSRRRPVTHRELVSRAYSGYIE